MNGPFTSASPTLQPFFDDPAQLEPENDLTPRRETLEAVANVGANAQAAPTQQPQGFGGRFDDIPFGGKPLTETDPMVMQQAQQAASRGIYRARLETPEQADFEKPLQEYRQSVEEAQAMESPESLVAAEKGCSRKQRQV